MGSTGMRRREVTANGVRLSYAEYGEPDAPPVLLLHGLGGGSEYWAEVAEALAPAHRVIALELRGHRRSEWPGLYGFDLMRDDVLAFADLLELRGVTLIGHSMGGVVSYLIAQANPQWLMRLITEDIPMVRIGDIAPVRVQPDGDVTFDSKVIDGIRAQIDSPDPSWWAGLSRINVPTLVLRGGPTSHIVQERIVATAAQVPGAETVEIPVGHRIHTADLEAFLAAIAPYVSG